MNIGLFFSYNEMKDNRGDILKKKILVLLTGICFFLTGCFGNSEKNILKDFQKKYENLKSYQLEGNLEILNNEDVYQYEVKVSYQKKDKFNVSLKNKANNHEQIILKNENEVYVLTPSLNKSFKFQSEWPYNNSQVYLIQSILEDILDDDNRTITESGEKYVIESTVNYPNNRKLVNQVVVLDSDLNLKEVKVVDEQGTEQMKMTFTKIDLNPNIDSSKFDINKIMTESVPTPTPTPSDGATPSPTPSNGAQSTPTPSPSPTPSATPTPNQSTGSIEDTIYPLYIPTGTVLTNEEKIAKTGGERIIMTFDGEKPFLLVEETSSIEEEFSIIPTYGEPYLLVDTVGALTDSSITWSSNGIDYYIVSDVMSQDELVDIARSITVIPNSK